MAKGKITRPEVVDEKVLQIGKDFAKSLDPAIKANKEWLKSFGPIKQAALDYAKIESGFKISKTRKEFLALKQKEEQLSKQTALAIKAENDALLKLQKVQTEKLRTDKLALDIKLKEEQAKRRNTQKTIEERVAEQALNKIKREQAKVTLGLLSPYQKLSKRLDDARLKAKDLGVQFGQNSKQFKAAQKEVLALDNRLKKLDTALGQSQRYVGNYERSLRGLRGIFLNLASALGFTGGLFAFITVMKNGLKIIRDFEKQNATLAGILQVEKSEMQDLRDDAKRLGETTVKTASDVTQLQIAYARLGYQQEDIINLTEATIRGSIAMNSELAETAELVGAIVNTFDDLESTDAPEIIDVLSLSTAKSALNFEKLQTALPIVAGAANAAGVPFTKLVALLGKLADAGIDTSSSATALRNIFIEAAADGLNYEQILQKIKGSTDKLTASNDEFGKRAAVSAAVLANNIDKTNELDEALQNAAGTAQGMADKELDTLAGALELLKSAWQGVVLGTDEANGISEKAKVVIQFLARNLQTILKVIGYVTGAWLAYKVVLYTINGITAAYRISVLLLSAAKAVLAGNTTRATAAMRLFKIELASTGVGAIVVLLGTLATAFVTLSDSVDDTTQSYKDMKKAADEASKSISRNRVAIIESQLAQIDSEIDNQKEANRKKLELLNQAIEDEKNGVSARRENEQKFTEILQDENEKRAETQEEINARIAEAYRVENQDRIESIKNRVRDERQETVKANAEQIKLTKEKGLQSTVIEEKAEKETISALMKLRDKLQKDLNKGSDKLSKEELKAAEKAAKQKTKLEEKLAKDAFELAKFTIEQRIDLLEKSIDDETKAFDERELLIKDKAAEELKLAKLIASEKFDASKEFTDKEIEALLTRSKVSKEVLKKVGDEELLIIAEYQAKKNEIKRDREDSSDDLEAKRILAAAEREKNIRQTALDNELTLENQKFLQKEGIYANELTAVENLERRKAQIKKRYAVEALTTQIQAVEELLLSENLSADKRAEYEAELAALKREVSDLTTENFVENDQREIESTRDKYERIAEISGRLADALTGLADAILASKIQAIDEEIAKVDEKYERELENENLSEEQRKTLEEQREKDREALEKKKRKEERKQAILAKTLAAFQIALNTATAIIGALAPPPVGLGPIAGIPFSIAAGVTGALQLGAVLAAPIPQYAKGTDNHPGGFALVGEERSEVIEEPGKAPYVIDRPTVLDLTPGTKVTPSLSDYQKLMRASILASVEIDNQKLNDFQAKNNFDIQLQKVDEQSIKNAIKEGFKNQKVHFHTTTNAKFDLGHEIWKKNNLNWR